MTRTHSIGLSLAAMLCLMAGCAATQWSAPIGMDQQAANTQMFECQLSASQATAPLKSSGDLYMLTGAAMREKQLFEACMASHGFSKS